MSYVIDCIDAYFVYIYIYTYIHTYLRIEFFKDAYDIYIKKSPVTGFFFKQESFVNLWNAMS